MRLLVTGSSGFVGRHLTRYAEAHAVTVIGFARGGGGVNQFEGDVRDASVVKRVVAESKPTHVAHLASTLPREQVSTRHYAVNVIGTINVLDAVAEEAADATVLVSSSSAVYGSGTPQDRPTRETDPLEPLSHYAVSKANEEYVGGYYHRSRGLRVIVARPFNLIGPGLPPGLLATDVARQLVRAEQGKGDPIVSVGSVESGRDFLDVRDLAAAYLSLLEGGEAGGTYNVCSGRLTPVRACVEQLVGRSRVPVSIETMDRAVSHGEVRQQVGDATRILERTGWRPQIALDDSLRDLLDECRRSYEAGEWQ